MLKKGRKREAKGLAVLYFIIGLIILLIILAVIYFALVKLDYSDKLDPDATVRSYVEQEDVIQPFVENQEPEVPIVEPEYVAPEDNVDLTAEPETVPEEAEQPAVEEPAIEAPVDEAPVDDVGEVESPAVDEPVAEEPVADLPVEEATPEPTALPADRTAQPMTDVPTLPGSASENGMIGITSCYVSQPDDNKLMYINGYGYVNEEGFDASQARSWLVVTQVASGQKIAYPLTLTPGISGLPHPAAVCQNPASGDFELYMDVSQYQEGIYSLALVIGYIPEGQKNPTYKYYPFSGDISFTVLNGQVVTPITAVDFE